MAKNKKTETTSETKSNRRKKSDSSSLLPVDTTKKQSKQGTEVIAKCDNLIPVRDIESMIFALRGVQVMLD